MVYYPLVTVKQQGLFTVTQELIIAIMLLEI